MGLSFFQNNHEQKNLQRFSCSKIFWIALSDLFLDTDTTIFHENIITELSASTYSIKELKKIMLFEVYPVCRWNLLSVAGEWIGFDEQWLMERIQNTPIY